MEWQANYFASCILLPRSTFIPDFMGAIQKRNITDRGFGLLFVDSQRCNQTNFYVVTDELRLIYRVSRSVIKVRLEALGLLTDMRTRLERPQFSEILRRASASV